ncbi:MAG: MtrB/PioB family decaheme-associated outer membrane protein [Acidobacteriaceae bacterium]|nr:MtrB/PioB family decaheme-associated outer membrane protein [Acidobacteriaceae bacterium]
MALPAYAQQEQTPDADSEASLFAPTWNTFQLLGRVSSISGDAARWQRYDDLRNGLLFTDARLQRGTDQWNLTAGADNVGWRNQRYFGSYERIGLLNISGTWDQIPEFYSATTRTPYTSAGGGVLVLDNAARQVGNYSAFVPLATPFNLQERRDIGDLHISLTPTPAIDVTGGFTTTKHDGTLPWGASFGLNNTTEVAMPYASRTNDVDMGLSWTNQRAMLRAGYSGSWFNNQNDTLVWDNPLVASGSTTSTAPSQGRTALWPSNSMQTVSTTGYAKFAHQTQVTGSFSFGWMNNNQPLLPFTINSALPQLTLPRDTTDASAQTVATTLGVVSRPQKSWRLSARFRQYDYNNKTPETLIPQFISYDTSLSTSVTGGPELRSYSRDTFDADATWTGLAPLAFTVGYTNNHNGYDYRTFTSTNENVVRVSADAVGAAWVTFRAHYEHGNRVGSGLDEASLVEIGEQSQMRQYDLANRVRDRVVGQIDLTPTEQLTLSVSGGTGSDHFNDSYFGLTGSDFSNVSFSADYLLPKDVGVGASYNYERYAGTQRSRSATTAADAANAARDWTADSRNIINYVSLYVRPPRIGRTETRISYDYSRARNNILYTVGSALPTPSPLPETFNTLQDLRFDARYRMTGHWTATLSYVYEPYRVFDFSFDPSVIDSIAQPGAMLLGYTQQPYTAHTGMFGASYHW